ncbi:MAG: hypothetical protein IT460_13065 [Planctomycetes bacterium]|nr:hypothetical protein [Planctomycetota bacterium]
MTATRSALPTLVVLLLAAVPARLEAADAPPAPAAPAADALATLEADVKAHLEARALELLAADVKAALAGHAKTTGKDRERHGALLAAILKGCTDDGVQKAAIEAIGATKDATLFPAVRPFLAQPNKKAVPPLLLPAIDASALLVAEPAVPLLLALVKETKTMPVGQAALKALGAFGASKKTRVTIVKELAATIGKDRPGVGGSFGGAGGVEVAEGGEDTSTTTEGKNGKTGQSRWGALGPAFVDALNRMTGQSCGTAEQWLDLIGRYKNRLDELFPSVR